MTQRGDSLGVYVHFPWCLAKCPYCDFVSYASARNDVPHGEYAEAILREIDSRAPSVAGRSVESIFLGGGTPSLWEPSELGRVLTYLRETMPCAPEMEVTVECNPTSIDEERARALLDAGVNRLSIGVQSVDDRRLRFLGRLHSADGARDAIRGAARSGIERVSADLIFGLPAQSVREATNEALELLDLGLEHLSCYQLTIEPATRFGALARRGRLPLADDAEVAESFTAIDEALTSRGLRHYEVSNYARPGQESRHNLGYWRGHEYLGFGCAAVGFLRTDKGAAQGRRYRNEPRPEQYLEALERGRQAQAQAQAQAQPEKSAVEESSELLDAATLLRERIMLGLRVDEGVDLQGAATALNTPGWTPQRARAAAWLEERGRIIREGGCVRIPREAWLWTDDTAARLF